MLTKKGTGKSVRLWRSKGDNQRRRRRRYTKTKTWVGMFLEKE